jgi:hypothetical protein
VILKVGYIFKARKENFLPEVYMEDQPFHLSVRKALLILLVIILFGVVVYFGAASITNQLKLENAVVMYYGRTLTAGQLEAEIGDLSCAAIPFRLPTENLWHQFFRQPTFMCFNSMDEANQWLMSLKAS